MGLFDGLYDAVSGTGFLDPGNIFDPNKGNRNASRKAGAQAVEAYNGVTSPSSLQLQLNPSEVSYYSPGFSYNNAGTTALEGTQKALLSGGYGDSSAAGLKDAYGSMDPRGYNAQRQALKYNQDLLKNGGHDAASDAYYEQQRADAEQSGRAQREAGMQQLAAQGRQSGGAGVLNQLMASRDVAANANNAGMTAAAMAQGRRDAAGQNIGNIGQVMAGQQLAQAAGTNAFGVNRAGEMDAAKQAMGGWMYGLGKQGADYTQNMSDKNIDRANTAADANVDISNRTALYNKNALQQAYEDSMNLASGKSNAYLGQANNYNAQHTPGVQDYFSGLTSMIKK